MCQLQVVARLDNKPLDAQDLQELAWLVRFGGETNKDATGVFAEGYCLKAPINGIEFEETRWKEVAAGLAGKRWACAHNRFQTIGDSKQDINNHPFIRETKAGMLAVAHNGHINNHFQIRNQLKAEGLPETDSVVICELIGRELDAGKTDVEAIKAAAEGIAGTFSVLVAIADKLYYFKGNGPDMTFALYLHSDGKRLLIGSTKETNLDLSDSSLDGCFWVPKYAKKAALTPSSGSIYSIGTASMEEIETFVEKKETYMTYQRPNSAYTADDWDDGYGFGWKRDKDGNWLKPGGGQATLQGVSTGCVGGASGSMVYTSLGYPYAKDSILKYGKEVLNLGKKDIKRCRKLMNKEDREQIEEWSKDPDSFFDFALGLNGVQILEDMKNKKAAEKEKKDEIDLHYV